MFFNIYDKKESLDSTDASLCLQTTSAYDMKSGSGKAWCCRRDECELALQRMLYAGGGVWEARGHVTATWSTQPARCEAVRSEQRASESSLRVFVVDYNLARACHRRIQVLLLVGSPFNILFPSFTNQNCFQVTDATITLKSSLLLQRIRSN